MRGRALRLVAPAAVLLTVVLATLSLRAPTEHRSTTSIASADLQAPAEAAASPQSGRSRVSNAKHRAARTEPPLLAAVAGALVGLAVAVGLFIVASSRRRLTTVVGRAPSSRGPPAFVAA